MNDESVGVEQWEQLIEAARVQVRRLVAIDPDRYALTEPNRGASEEQLLAAERRLGYRIPAQYRQFLGVANGWFEWDQFDSLRAADELGHGLISEHEGLTVQTRELWIEWPSGVDLLCFQSAEYGRNEGFLLIRDSEGLPSGTVVLADSAAPVHDDFAAYLESRVAELSEWIDGEELGPHGRYWGRDLRIEPPTMATIVERLAGLRAELAELQSNDAPAGPNPPAASAALDGLEDRLGRRLHPEHREFLSVADGWPDRAVDILGVAEIADGRRWTERVEEVQRFEAEVLRRASGSALSAPRAPHRSSADLALAVPFAVGMNPLGVDGEDGFVRHVLKDEKYLDDLGGGFHMSRGTVREFLLSEIDGMCQQIDAYRAAFGSD